MPSLFAGFSAAFLVAALNFTAPALAQTRSISPQAKTQQVKLTEDLVTRFLATMGDVRALSKKYRGQTGRAHPSRDPMTGITGFLQGQNARTAMQSVLTKHGFSNLNAWMNVARTVIITYGFVKSGRTPQQIKQQMQAAIAQIQNNPNLTPQQRSIILKDFAPSMSHLQPSPENYALVKRMQPLIAAKIERKRPNK